MMTFKTSMITSVTLMRGAVMKGNASGQHPPISNFDEHRRVARLGCLYPPLSDYWVFASNEGG
jgi:hypothetical protein